MNWQNKIFSLLVQIPADDGDKGGLAPGLSGYVTEQDPPPPTPTANAQGAGGNNPAPAVPPATPGTGTPPAASAGAADGNKQGAEENITGYETNETTPPIEPPVVPPATTPPVTPPTEEKLELDLRGLNEDAVLVKDIREKAKTLGLNKEQAQKLLDTEKTAADNYAKDLAKREADAKVNRTKLFSDWEKELKSDPDFGGVKFADNVHQVNKLINDHFPSIKKELTETKGRLQPKYMRELANLAKVVYAEGKVVNGGDGSGSNPQQHSPLDFYTKNKT